MYTSDDIFIAMQRSDQNKLLKIISSGGINLDEPDECGCTALHWAAYLGNLPAIRSLIAAGATIAAKNNFGETPFHFAAFNGNIPSLRLLFNAGSNIEEKNNIGETPLHFAARAGQLYAVKFLKQHGADIDAVDDTGRTPLLELATTWKGFWDHKSLEILKELKGKDLDVKSSCGWSPLHWASYQGLNVAIEFLVRSGANIEVKNDEGNTPIKYAMGCKDYKTFDVLLRLGADINSRNNLGETLLHLRAECGSYDDMAYIIKCGAFLDISDIHGHTPLCIIINRIKQAKHPEHKLKLLGIGTVIEAIDHVLYKTPTSDSFREKIAELKTAYSSLALISDTEMEHAYSFSAEKLSSGLGSLTEGIIEEKAKATSKSWFSSFFCKPALVDYTSSVQPLLAGEASTDDS